MADDQSMPSVNLSPQTPQGFPKSKATTITRVHVEDVKVGDEADGIEVVDSKDNGGNSSDTNPQSGSWTGNVVEGVQNLFRNNKSKRNTPPSATSSHQEPYHKIQMASDSPDSF
jgi:hypothetical protein